MDLNGEVTPTYTFPGFPTTVYEFLYGKPDGTAPPIEGSYPHAVVKGLFNKDGFVDTAQDGDLTLTPNPNPDPTPNPDPNPGVVDVSQDGECSSKDSATQWLDCGIPCPIGEESRMSKEDLAP